MNLETDYTYTTLALRSDYEGEVTAVLSASNHNTGKRKSILYLHGYIDYFFHPHLGEQCHAHDFDFYALDLRKYGRALLPHQHPNYCKSIEEYFEEISMALREIEGPVTLLAHSTGGLIASAYMNDGEERNSVERLVLNSPFLDFNQTPLEKKLSLFAANLVSKFSDYAKIEGALSPVYAQSIHKEHQGEWHFNLDWKPIKGFPTYFIWVLAIDTAQRKLAHSDIQVPVLVMHSSGSKKLSKFSDDAMTHDIVLNVEDIKRVGQQLGKDITLLQIDKAQHDIFLSPEPVRNNGFEKMFDWLRGEREERS